MPVRLSSSRLKSGAKGVAVVEWRGDQVISDVDGMASQRLDLAAQMVVAKAKASMNEPKSGKPVPKRRRRVKGRPPSPKRQVRTRSAPGEAPATQKETLRNSVTWDTPSQLRRRVGTNVDYGLFLELGAPKRNLAARPWLEVALWACASKIKRLFKK